MSDPFRTFARLLPDYLQLTTNVSQTSTGETFIDPPLKANDRLEDAFRIERLKI